MVVEAWLTLATALPQDAVEAAAQDVARAVRLITPAKVMAIVLLAVLTAVAVRVARLVLDVLAERFGRFRLRLKQAGPILQILFWSVAVYIAVAGIVRPSQAALIGVLAGSGVAIGFALQDLLKDIIGGLLIVIGRPFQVGDKVQVGGHYGEIVNIGLRTTRLVTLDDSTVTIPNARVHSEAVSNANSGALDCQVVTEVWLPAHVDLDLVRRIGFEAAASSRYAYLKKPIVVIAESVFRETFLIVLKVKAYVLDHRYERRFATDVMAGVQRELVSRGILTSELVRPRY